MADPLNQRQRMLIAALAMGGAAPVAGQSALPDPMRPPSAVDAASATSGPANVLPGTNGLQTIILHRKGKPLAVINGETVELGGKLGEARLVKLSETEAVLQGPQGREVLRLTPAAGKKAPAAVPPKSAAQGKR